MTTTASIGRKAFLIGTYIILMILSAIAILPFIHLLAVSLSSGPATMAGKVALFPVDFTFEGYRFLWNNPQFLRSMGNTILRIALGVPINLFIVFITAYPLSKEVSKFRLRTVYVWFFAFTMFFGGGLIPSYMIVKMTGLLNTIWALVIPGAVNVWNVILMVNFFRQVPKELEESAVIDGAGQWIILWRIFLPVSIPAIATVLLFATISHWNSWFDGVFFLNTLEKYPLQSYIASIIMDSSALEQLLMKNTNLSPEQIERLMKLGEKTVKAAQVFLGALPIILLYPFLQRFFVKGLIVGSVKG